MKINAYQRLMLYSISAVLKLATKKTSEFREIPKYLDDCVQEKKVDADFLDKLEAIRINIENMWGGQRR